MQKSQSLDLLSYLKKIKTFNNTPQQIKPFDYFISKNRSHLQISKQQAIQLINLIQHICMHHSPIFKLLQVLRLLTKPPQYRNYLKVQFFHQINAIIPQASSNPSLLIQILALDLRFIQIDAQIITDQMFSPILDLLVMNNPDITKIIIQITRQLTAKGINKVLQQVWYVGRLLFALQRLDPMNKPKLVNLIRDLLQCKHFNQNFRRINGVPTLINQLKKSQGNLLLRISILHFIYKLLLTTKTQAIYDFKLNNFTSLISLKIKQPLNYKQMILVLKILTHLMLDNDISSKYIQQGIQDAIALLVRSHPTNCHMIKFQDIQQNQQQQAFQQFRLLLLRLLRYIGSLDRNRKVFKQIFPMDLLAPFVDIGHFIKSLKSYLPTLKVFNQLDNSKVLAIQDQYQKLAKLFGNKNYKLQVVGNYNLVQQLGQGGFGSVFLAKKGANEYALKKIKIDNMQSQKDNIQQLSRQVKIYKGLKHPNIVKFYESFVEEGYLYIVMQVIKGCDLSQLIRSQSEKDTLFQQDIIWRILICLVSVLRYLHVQKSIIHRDLNPSNIMVDHKFNIKVTDFGLAKSIGSQNKMSQSFVGTVSYSAPQIVQRHSYNQKADIWSLGCILHQLMCLKPTFSGNNPLLLAKIIVNRQLNAQLPQKYCQQLRDFVNLCLTKQQQKRPNVTQLMQKIVGRIVQYSDQLKQKQSNLSDQIVQLNKKINSGGLGATHTRLFGNSLYNSNQMQMQSVRQKAPQQPLPPNQDMLRQTQLVKIDSEVLNKIGQDPMNKFIDITRKLSLIASTQASLKKNFKKYVVDTFYNRIIISDEFQVSQVKNELNKLINLSKQQVTFIGVKFQLKQNYIKSITYQMLYFYVQQLYQLIRK